jgi:immune inhibitor A
VRSRVVVLVALLTAALVAAAPASPGAAPPDPAALLPARALAAVADVAAPPRATGWLPGEPIGLTGTVGIYDRATGTTTGAPLTLDLRVDNDPARSVGPVVAGPDGVFTAVIPGEATAGLAPGVHAIWAVAQDGGADETEAIAAKVALVASADGEVVLRHQFVSSTGWVKPGGGFPLTTRVENHSPVDLTDLTVTIAAAPSSRFADAEPLAGSGTATVMADTVTWTIPVVPAATADAPGVVTLVTEATAVGLGADPRLVWKDLSSTATLTGGGLDLAEISHGPKVIPPSGGFETARYGDKPFPMVPVKYVDRQPQADNDPADLDRIVNSPDFEGSTFNLYQEMSFGQLFPQGVVPSAGIAAASYSEVEQEFRFTTPAPTGTCRGATVAAAPGAVGSPLFDTRIEGGWYQLPGTTEYYGGDYPAFSLGVAGSIDSACGQIGKGVYDAAVVADPEIDYNLFDSDRDGVVDFFMLIFVGCGGNGGSQIPLPGTPITNELCAYTDAPYDNIWPHSSSLEMQYTDPATGLRGYVSHDQLRSLTEIPQCFVDETYTAFDDCAEFGGTGKDDLPTPVRVGPYNVNPETVFEAASVIGHEYGHHLGLPDFYSSYDAYGTFNLMAADYGQNMTGFSKQDLGWVVPRFLQPGDDVTVTDWDEIKSDIGEIHWETPDGESYVLSAANGDQNVRNGLMWSAKLPIRQILDPAVVAAQASGSKLLWSGRGNDFGCHPTGAHNIDLFLPELRDVADGAEILVTMKTAWDIEWDWDYGFVLTTSDGANYASQPSENGNTTTTLYNPNQQQCFIELDNGLTGQSGTYAQGEPFVTVARNPAENDYSAPLTFVEDAYDISNLAGSNGVVRFSYFTDAAFDRPGWFIDDLVVTVDGKEIYATDFEDGLDHDRFFNGGCGRDGFRTGSICTDGWFLIDAAAGDTADHAYYLELRDRASFDFEGYGQSDRGLMAWEPGLFVEYTDENHGYGNNGVPQPPSQHYLDSQPVEGAECATGASSQCNNASFTIAEGDTTFSDDPAKPHLDNFDDPRSESGRWTFDFGCLTSEVLAMAGHDTAQLQADLVADVRLRAGDGCAVYDIPATADGGEQPAVDAPADARIGVRATTAAVGDTVTFDGSASTGDLPLAYAWNLGDGTTAEGPTVNHAYGEPGTYTVTLAVMDATGDTDTATVQMTVTAAPGGGTTPLPTTGGGAALAGLVLVGAAVGITRLRRRD